MEKGDERKTSKNTGKDNFYKKMTETKMTVIHSDPLDRFERKQYENSANRQDSVGNDLSRGRLMKHNLGEIRSIGS